MRFLGCIFACMLAATSANAQALSVKTGEHKDFTRVVVPLPEGATWSLETGVGSRALIVDGHSDGFDLIQAFDVIPRKRLAALVAGPSTLELQLACNCPVRAFEEQNGFIVLDISDGPLLSVTPDSPRQTAPLPATDYNYGDLLWNSEASDEATPAATSIENAPTVAETPKPPDTDALVLQRQEELLESVAHAASRGLLTLRDPVADEPSDIDNDASEVDLFDASENIEEPETSGAQIRVTDSGYVPSQDVDDRIASTGASCPDPSRIDLSDWATDEPFGVQLARSNRALYDELGRLQERAVLDRARLYLHFGFGAEALQTFALIPAKSATHPELLDIASILEFGFVRNPRVLHRYAACESAYALWGALAPKELTPDLVVARNAALRALTDMPAHIKTVLAPELSARFASRQDIKSAAIAVRTSNNILTATNQNLAMAESRLKDLKGEHSEAESDLLEIISANADQTPEAIVALVDKRLLAGKDVPADIALLAETYAFEHRNSDIEADIYRAFVLSAALSGQYSKAFEAFEARPSELLGQPSRTIADAIQKTVTKTANDGEFLQFYFSKFAEISDLIEDETKTNVAKRLLDLGFVDQVAVLIDDISPSYQTEKFLLIQAEVLLHNGKPDQAIRIIVNLDTPDALRLRAQALLLTGDNAGASESFSASRDPDAALSADWLAEDWLDQVDEQAPVFGAFSHLAKESTDPIVVDDEMLQNVQSAIAASMSARSTLATALDALQLSDQEGG